MKFSITVNMGNDSMRTSEDLARTLRHLADRIEQGDHMNDARGGIMTLPIRDYNGNRCGWYTFNSEPDSFEAIGARVFNTR